jgi:hypothetical protein
MVYLSVFRGQSVAHLTITMTHNFYTAATILCGLRRSDNMQCYPEEGSYVFRLMAKFEVFIAVMRIQFF